MKMHFLDIFRILQRKYSKIKNCTLSSIFFIFYCVKLGPPGDRRTQNLKAISMSLESQQVSLLIKTIIFLVNLFPWGR